MTRAPRPLLVLVRFSSFALLTGGAALIAHAANPQVFQQALSLPGVAGLVSGIKSLGTPSPVKTPVKQRLAQYQAVTAPTPTPVPSSARSGSKPGANARIGTRAVMAVNLNTDEDDAIPGNGSCDANETTIGSQCTLRAAITEANALPGADTINFAITGSTTITPTSELPPITQTVNINGASQSAPGGRPLIVINGASAGASSGLRIHADRCTITSLIINGFNLDGITIDAGAWTGNRIQGCFIGTNASGSGAVPNAGSGIAIFGGPNNNIIGGSTAARNIISGNGVGISISGTGTNSNQVKSNFIGTNVDGELRLPNTGSGIAIFNGAQSNQIGGSAANDGNLIAGNNGSGITISGTGTNANTVGGNRIGGLTLANSFNGIALFAGAQNNTIGGPASANTISGNTLSGVSLSDAGTDGNTVSGNFIGTGSNGSGAVPNGAHGVIIVDGASSNTIGGTTPPARNIISGNGRNGVGIGGTGNATSGDLTRSNVVAGNFIGTDRSGTVALGNGLSGVSIADSAKNNTVGGTAPNAGNLISGGTTYGISLEDAGTSGNLIQGNTIGLSTEGGRLGNTLDGISIRTGANANIVGFDSAGVGARNTIVANGDAGISIEAGSNSNIIRSNDIGTNSNDDSGLGNSGDGVSVESNSNQILRNTILENGDDGVSLINADSNLIQQNNIGFLSGQGNTGDGVFIGDNSNNNIIGGTKNDTFSISQGKGNLIARNGGAGVNVFGSAGNFATGNTIRGNTIENNTGLGIDLRRLTPSNEGANVPTPNDDKDPDSGNNNLQNYPVITSVGGPGGRIIGSFNSASEDAPGATGTNYILDFYYSTDEDPSHFGEGSSGLYTDTIFIPDTETDGTINFSFTIPTDRGYASGDFITVTATNLATGDTSEFSRAVKEVQTFVVNSTFDNDDGACNATNCTLREAINAANASAGGATISFNIFGDGPHIISVGDDLPPITKTTTIDGYTQGSATTTITDNAVPNTNPAVKTDPLSGGTGGLNSVLKIVVDGGNGSLTSAGLTVAAPNCVIKGLVIANFNGVAGYSGILVPDSRGNGLKLTGCYIGTDSDGTTATPNNCGVRINTAAVNITIGGLLPAERNLISGNAGQGAITMTGSPGTAGQPSLTLLGNLIGTDRDGTGALGNNDGVTLNNSPFAIIGGTATGAGNVIAGTITNNNLTLNAGSNNCTIQGNFLGTNANGTAALGGAAGMITVSDNNTIGGSVTGARNIISGNTSDGVYLSFDAESNFVQGNYIGTKANGSEVLPNGNGVEIRGANTNTIGGTSAAARNVISGNSGNGVWITGTTTGAIVLGNYIGVGANGTTALSNLGNGVFIEGTNNNIIGDDIAGARNVIASNGLNGITISSGSNNVVQNNFIGTDVSGNAKQANSGIGISVFNAGTAPDNNTIGGTSTLARNVISGNSNFGIAVLNATRTTIQGNSIGVGFNGTTALGNAGGIRIESSGVTVGGPATGAGNIIANNNNGGGIRVFSGTGNPIRGNSIFANQELGLDLVGGTETNRVTANDPGDTDSGPNNLQNFPVLTNARLSGGNTLVDVSLNSLPGSYALDFFSNPAGADPSQNGEGQTFISSDSIVIAAGSTSANKTVTLTGNLVGSFVTATATSSTNNTSEFSRFASAAASGPTITSFTVLDRFGAPGGQSGPRGSIVKITGTGFTGITAVEFGGNNTTVFTVDSATQITATVPGTAATGPIRVATASNSANSGTNFTATAGFLVTNTNDANAGSLREGINYANNEFSNNAGGPTLISFGIPGTNLHTITLDSSLPALIQPTTIDGYTQPGAVKNTNATGGFSLNTTLLIEVSGPAANGAGFRMNANNSVIRGLIINKFSNSSGVTMIGSNNRVEGCYIGTTANGLAGFGTGSSNSSNGDGVSTNPGFNSIIGGSTPETRNLISGNRGSGVAIFKGGTAAVGNVKVQGNLIGTNKTGNAPLNNNTVGTEGINVSGLTGNLIGGPSEELGNVISGNGRGISLFTSNNVVQSNFIGTNHDGTAAVPNNGIGVFIQSGQNNLIGGVAASPGQAPGNIISGNAAEGIDLFGSNNIVQGNLVGTDAAGSGPLGNAARGITVRSNGNRIGGSTPSERNVISANGQDGILLTSAGNNTVIEGNYIGTDVNGTADLGNAGHGVFVNSVTNNFIGLTVSGPGGGPDSGAGNRIAFNDQDGVFVTGSSAQANHINGNSIFRNDRLGINLASGASELPNGVTPNVDGDLDGNPNGLQNFPVLTSAANVAGGTRVIGTLNSTPNTTFRIEFFDNTATDPSGQGEGERFIQAINRSTGSGNIALIDVVLPTVVAGRHITATATDDNGNTSEFSNFVTVAAAPSSGLVVNTVLDTALANDGACTTNPDGCTLREAITIANSRPGADTITFNIPGGAFATIAPRAPLPFLINPGTFIDGFSQPGFTGQPLITISGASLLPPGTAASGLEIRTSGCRVRGLTLFGWTNAVNILGASATGNRIETCFIGTNAVGGSAGSVVNTNGIKISGGAKNNIIGGPTVAQGNLISGNRTLGVSIIGTGTTGNRLIGNRIGTNLSGLAALANTFGVQIEGGASGNSVGGANPGTGRLVGNLISGNTLAGIVITGNNSNGNLIQGNAIGLKADGSGLGNGPFGDGIQINAGAKSNLVGGLTASVGNVISANRGSGVRISNASANNVRGNLIGFAGDGLTGLGNGRGVVLTDNAQNNFVGGTDAGAKNFIGGNEFGVLIANGSSNAVLGNAIGINAAGAARSNRFGVAISGGTRNTIGGTANGARNLISGSTDANIFITDSATANTVTGNLIGTNPTGAAPLGAFSTTAGIWIDGGSNGNLIGGTTPAAANVISGNAGHGILIQGRPVSSPADPQTRGNRVTGNIIGLGTNGARVSNGEDGIAMTDRTTANLIGTPGSGRNVVSGNGRFGISISGIGTNANVVHNNWVGLNLTGAGVLGNAEQGIVIHDGAQRNRIGSDIAGTGNVVAGNGFNGIGIGGLLGPTSGQDTAFNVVQGNFVGTDPTGTKTGFGQPVPGIAIAQGAHDNLIGGPTATPGKGAGNVISGNNSDGIFIGNPAGANNRIQGNLIGLKADGSGPLPNTNAGIRITGTSKNNIIGGGTTGTLNVISGNQGEGVIIEESATGNRIAGNFIGTNLTGTATFGNGAEGVRITNAPGNVIGGTTPALRNLISGNGRLVNAAGVAIVGSTAKNNSIQGNLIGTNAAGNGPLPNLREGVYLNALNNTVGGTTATPGTGAGNVISGNKREGVRIGTFFGGTSSGNKVLGNLIGLNEAGNGALPNELDGVTIAEGATGNSIGSGTLTGRNVISGNLLRGVLINGTGTNGNKVQGNWVGTDRSGQNALGNKFVGITVNFSAANNVIGGFTNQPGTGAGNVVSGNSIAGVTIEEKATTNQVFGNLIGFAADAIKPLPNIKGGQGGWGVLVVGASGNKIGSAGTGANLIANNQGPGVGIAEDIARGATNDNSIRGNTIFNNGDIGIDLTLVPFTDGVSANDAGDGDGGPNRLQNFPVINRATQSAAGQPLVLNGILDSTAGRTFALDIYANTAADPTEGRTYLGTTTIPNGAFSRTIAVAPSTNLLGQFITLTATDLTTGDTSEFSQAKVVTLPAPSIAVNLTPPTVSLEPGQTQQFTATVTGTTNQNVTFSVDGGTANGTITAGGLYTAPFKEGTFTVRAVSVADPTVFDTSTVTVGNPETTFGWGYNDFGSVGNASRVHQPSPVEVRVVRSARLLVAGGSHSLAVVGNTLYAWGDNDSGQLGTGDQNLRDVPTAITLPSGIRADELKAIACGWYHSLAVTGDGRVLAWGLNRDGQCGKTPGTPPVVPTPTLVSGLSGITQVSGGTLHSLALDGSGKVWAWGNNFYGQLGNGTVRNSIATPAVVRNLPNAQAIGGGGGHSVAILTDGSVRAWGWNFYGQLGDGLSGYQSNGDERESALPVVAKGATGVQLSVGYAHNLLLKSDDTILSWGNNFYGQLARVTPSANPNGPLAAPVLGNLGSSTAFGGVRSIAAGSAHSLAIKTDGSLWSWGYNEFGSLGLGPGAVGTNARVPQQVTALKEVKTIAAGYAHSLAIGKRNLGSGGGGSEAQLPTSATESANDPDDLSDAAASVSAASLALTFTSKLAGIGSLTPGSLQVVVNGRAVAVQSLSIKGQTLTILLKDGALEAGDQITVSWRNLLTQSGQRISGTSPILVAE